jgi:hypothetical protein
MRSSFGIKLMRVVVWTVLALCLSTASGYSQFVMSQRHWLTICDQQSKECSLVGQFRALSGQLVNVEFSLPAGIASVSAWKRSIKRAQVWAPGGPSMTTDRCNGSRCLFDAQSSAALLSRVRHISASLTVGTPAADAMMSVQVVCEDGSRLGPLELPLDDLEVSYGDFGKR